MIFCKEHATAYQSETESCIIVISYSEDCPLAQAGIGATVVKIKATSFKAKLIRFFFKKTFARMVRKTFEHEYGLPVQERRKAKCPQMTA